VQLAVNPSKAIAAVAVVAGELVAANRIAAQCMIAAPLQCAVIINCHVYYALVSSCCRICRGGVVAVGHI
jgi:hypothetical protein